MCFKNDLTATAAARIAGVNRNTANRYYNLLRRAILNGYEHHRVFHSKNEFARGDSPLF